jgi:iron complex outermembrane receptor protein
LDAEDLNAYELGWRWRASPTLTFDAALYRNEYKKLIGGVPRAPTFELEPVPALVLESDFANINDLRVSGIELVAEWRASEWLSFEAQGAWQDSEAQVGIQPGPTDPERMLALRTRIDLPRDVELDLTWRSVSELTGYGIPAYDLVDMRAGWQPTKAINLSLAVENVFDDEHIEHIGDLTFAPAVTMGRMVIGRISWKPGI